MLFKNQDYLRSLDAHHYTQMMRTHMPLGIHPDTGDRCLTPILNQYSGTYIVGVQGAGKSVLMQNMILHRASIGGAIIVIDPHGDLVDNVLARLPEYLMDRVFLIDLEDEKYLIGINLLNFPHFRRMSAADQAQAIDRVMHVWETLWPDVLSQANMPRFLRAACMVLMANPGSTLVDMQRLLTDTPYRAKLLKAVQDPTVLRFWEDYDSLSAAQQRQRVEPLIARLESLFMGRPLIRAVVGQRETSVNFREASESEKIILIKIPLKKLPQDGRFLGTLLVAQIYETVFSFANLPEGERPGLSLYIDEFQHFCTPDFSEMLSEGRKFGLMATLGHQYRGQLPNYLQKSTMTARNKICFRLTREDAGEMAHEFVSGETYIKAEDIDPESIDELLRFGSENHNVQIFIDKYLRTLHSQSHGGKVEIKQPGFQWGHLAYWMVGTKAPDKAVTTPDPKPHLNHLFYEVMKTGNPHHYIVPQIVYGFANCGRGFYAEFYNPFFHGLNKDKLLRGDIAYPPHLVANGRWTRKPDSGTEQLYHFLFHLQETMKYLAEHPIGKKSARTSTDIAADLMRLPGRAAYVRSGTDVGVIYTDDSPPAIDGDELWGRICLIQQFTRQKYCKLVEAARDIDVPTKPNEQIDTDTNVDNEDQPTFSRWEEIE